MSISAQPRKINKKKLGFIHHFIPSSTKINEVILLLHGTGGDENYLLNIGRRIAPGAAILSPRGNVFENGSNRFCLRSPDGEFDVTDVKLRTDELTDFIEKAAKRYKFDVNRLSVIGYSNGASIAAGVILTHPGIIKRAVLFHPGLPLIPQTPLDLANNRVLITCGRYDTIVMPGESLELAKLLKQFGANVEIYRHGRYHELVKNEIMAAKRFLES
jgi:phospholipase/carboxylesterase